MAVLMYQGLNQHDLVRCLQTRNGRMSMVAAQTRATSVALTSVTSLAWVMSWPSWVSYARSAAQYSHQSLITSVI